METTVTRTEPAAGTKYYVLHVWGGVDVETHGPFATEEEQFAQAKALFDGDTSDEDSIFALDISPDGTPVTTGYSPDAFVEGD